MKKVLLAFTCLVLLLTACDVWNVEPQPVPIWSPIPSRTPGVVTATPVIIPLPFTQTPPTSTATALAPTNSATPAGTSTEIAPSETATAVLSMSVDILGCNTSFDITHGMGEVTNAYVTLRNTGEVDLPDSCALLRAADEGREHPDKKVCIADLPVHNQVTLKLTVDSTYKQDTAIQVDALSNEVLLLRVDKSSCTDISLFGGAPSNLGLVGPIQP